MAYSYSNDEWTILAKAPLGSALLVITVGETGIMGMLKEVRATGKAMKDTGDGPASSLIEQIIKRAKDKDIQEEMKNVSGTTWDPEKSKQAGIEILEAAAPIIDSMSSEDSEQVKNWLVNIAKKVSEAASDKGTKVKVSNAEEEAIAQIQQILESK